MGLVVLRSFFFFVLGSNYTHPTMDRSNINLNADYQELRQLNEQTSVLYQDILHVIDEIEHNLPSRASNSDRQNPTVQRDTTTETHDDDSVMHQGDRTCIVQDRPSVTPLSNAPPSKHRVSSPMPMQSTPGDPNHERFADGHSRSPSKIHWRPSQDRVAGR